MKVLVCDDEPNILRLIEAYLERRGCQVVTALDGEACLEKILTEPPDLCVLDVMMPRMDGIEVLKSIRRHPQTENIPVILLTARAEDSDIFCGYHHGADMVLTKPFNPFELVSFMGPVR